MPIWDSETLATMPVCIVAKRWAQLGPEKKIFQRIDNEGIEDLVNYFCDNAENVNEVCLAGGEPLMIKENERIVSALIEKNPRCFVMVNTNLSQLKGNKIFELLKQLPNNDEKTKAIIFNGIVR